MACACKGRNRATASGGAAPVPAGTFRVMVNGRKVYETNDATKAKTVAAGFTGATILDPGQSA